MNDQRFDDLARKLARSTSRRSVVKAVGAGIAGALLSAMGRERATAETGVPGTQGNEDCEEFCKATFPPGPDRGQCTSEGAQHQGLCFSACGPNGPSGQTGKLCGGPSLSTTTCCVTGVSTCINGTCCPNARVCGSTCLTAPCNTAQCLTCQASTGTCVSTCNPTLCQVCNGSGTCVSSCAVGTVCCGGHCVSNICTGGQVFNPATCLCACPTGTTLCGGSCVSSVCTVTGETFNTATCSCQCPSGQTVINGVCAACGPTFVCGQPLTSCGTPAPGGTCFCLLTPEGFTACGENFTCNSTSTCTTSAQCVTAHGAGWFCQSAGTGCCGGGVCVPPCGTTGFAAPTVPPGPGTNAGGG